MLIQTAYPVSTRDYTERMVKMFESNYAKAELEQLAANTTHMNAEEKNQILGIIKDFEDLFDGTLVEWDTESVELDLKTDYKPFN